MSDKVRSIARMDDEQLRHAALIADAFMAIEAARAYGFVEGGPRVNVRCMEDMIAAASERGLTWTDDERTEMATELICEWNVLRD